MSILDIFKSAAVAKAPDQQSQNSNPTVPNANTPASNGTPAAIPAAAKGDESPLAGFADLWKASDTDVKLPDKLSPTMNADPTKIMQAAKGVDFSKAITPEALTNAAKGDPSALAQVVNEAAQAGFAQSSVATAKIVEAALARQAQDFQDKYIPEVLRRERINNALTADNPLFSNPAVAPMMEMLKSQMATKYPTASAAEVKAKAEEYMTGFASEIAKATGKSFGDAAAGGAGGAGGSGASQEEDWSKFFGLS